jgi:hypothetical protein
MLDVTDAPTAEAETEYKWTPKTCDHNETPLCTMGVQEMVDEWWLLRRTGRHPRYSATENCRDPLECCVERMWDIERELSTRPAASAQDALAKFALMERLVVEAALVAAFAVSLLALVLAMTTSAGAGQMLVPGYRGPHYAPSYRYNGPPPGSYLNGYVRPYRPNPAPFIAGALLGAVVPQILPPSRPVARPVAAPMPEPAGDPMDAIPDASPNTARITRQEIDAALADWCSTNGTAPLCQKLSR